MTTENTCLTLVVGSSYWKGSNRRHVLVCTRSGAVTTICGTNLETALAKPCKQCQPFVKQFGSLPDKLRPSALEARIAYAKTLYPETTPRSVKSARRKALAKFKLSAAAERAADHDLIKESEARMRRRYR